MFPTIRNSYDICRVATLSAIRSRLIDKSTDVDGAGESVAFYLTPVPLNIGGHEVIQRMSNRLSIEEIRSRTYKSKDAWWTVLLVDPMASRLVQWVAPYRWITPNRLTGLALVFGLAAAACFAQARPLWLVAGALLFHVSFVVDCMDGKIARLNANGSVFGVWLDFIVDEIRIIACTFALMGGAFHATGREGYLFAGLALLGVHLIRYMSAWHMGKVRSAMRKRKRRYAELDEVNATVDGDTGEDDNDADDLSAATDVRGRVRDWLATHRIRTHLVSGIEFQMAAFVIGPMVGSIVVLPAVVGAIVLAFEMRLAYKLYQQAQQFEQDFPPIIEAPASPTPTLIPAQRGSRPDRIITAH